MTDHKELRPTPDEADQILQRFINSHFSKGKFGDDCAKFTIPADPKDDDVMMDQFINNYRDLLAALDEQQRMIERLPVTKDGVPIVPGMCLYELQFVFDEAEVRKVNPVHMRTFPDSAIIEECYSTREAAEAAKEASNE